MSDWRDIASAPIGKWCFFWLVTENPNNSGIVHGQISAYNDGKSFWDGHSYRPTAWLSHWMPEPDPPTGPYSRPIGSNAEISCNDKG